MVNSISRTALLDAFSTSLDRSAGLVGNPNKLFFLYQKFAQKKEHQLVLDKNPSKFKKSCLVIRKNNIGKLPETY